MAALQKEGKSKYQIMMRETSDNMQDLAMAYGERQTFEACIASLAKFKNAENKKVFTEVIRLFAVDVIRRDLGFYMIEKAINAQAAENSTATLHSLNNFVASNVDALLVGLNVPAHALYAPIAGDWVKYYASPNYGEIHGAKL